MDNNAFDGLTVYLLGETNPDNCLKAPNVRHRHRVLINNRECGVIYVEPSGEERPKWLKVLQDHLSSQPAEHEIHRLDAAWVIPHKGNCYAITFGQGRHLLKSQSKIQDFGLKVVLNSVDPDSIRSVNKHTIDASTPHKRLQATDDISIEQFGIDIGRDLLRYVQGRPKSKNVLGSSILGGDSLRIGTRVTVPEIPKLIESLEEFRLGTTYRQRFEWVDKIRKIREDAKIKQLEAQVERMLAGGKSANERCFLALPDLTDVHHHGQFRVSGSNFTVSDLSIPALLPIFKLTHLDLEFLKKKELFALNSEGETVSDWSLYDCLQVEAIMDSMRYLLIAGQWYEVDPSFEAQIKEAVAGIPESAHSFPDYDDAEEADYLKRVQKGAPGKYALVDRQKIYYGGGKSNFELCDLYTSDQEFIHVKRYEGSSKAMSHLFFQALTSARIFKGDKEFRSKANEMLPVPFRLSDPALPIEPRDFEVVLAVVSSHEKSLAHSLPFFSQIALHNTYKVLAHELEYRVSVAKIKNATNVRYARAS